MVLIKIALHPFFRTMMVYSSKPSFDIHYMDMHLRKRLPIIIKRIKKRLVPGSILLLHDRMPDSDKLLVEILDFIKKEGYTVVPLDKLMQQIT